MDIRKRIGRTGLAREGFVRGGGEENHMTLRMARRGKRGQGQERPEKKRERLQGEKSQVWATVRRKKKKTTRKSPGRKFRGEGGRGKEKLRIQPDFLPGKKGVGIRLEKGKKQHQKEFKKENTQEGGLRFRAAIKRRLTVK